jgi:dTDP-4-dehydrorhamnose reductase
MLVVTGASGLLGPSVLLGARDQGRSAVGLCHRHLLALSDIPTFSVDLTDAKAAQKVLTSLRPTQIIHCAAAANVDWCEDHAQDAMQINSVSPAWLVHLAMELGARFLYVSTDAVFDGKQGNYTETDTPAPLNVYAESKLRGEQEVLRQDPSALVVRVNIYGWNAQSKLSLAEWVLEQLASGKPVPGFTDVHFTPILVNDLSEVLLTMLDRELKGLYHVAGSERISKFEFAQWVAVTFGFDPGQIVPARMAEAHLRARRPPDMSLNTSKISSALGRSMPDVQSGLSRFRTLRDAGYPQQLKSYLNGTQK